MYRNNYFMVIEKPLKVGNFQRPLNVVAVWTGLEPATPCVTGRYSNQLNYHTFCFIRSFSPPSNAMQI